MTGPPQWRPAAGWLARRLTEFVSDAGAGLGADRHILPPRRLRARVGAPRVSDYVDGGHAAALALEAALAPRTLRQFATVLDFGCGPGRVLTHVAALRGRAEGLCGVDVDTAAVGWAQAHLAGVTVAASRAQPPLPVADGAFALVYSISVLSHLNARDGDAWLAELARVLRPGGVALISTHGPSAHAAFRSGAVSTAWCAPGAFTAHGPLGAEEILAVPYRLSRWSRGDLPGVGDGYGLTFHGAGYVRAHWGRWLTVEAILPRAISGWQDLVVARKPG